MPFTFSHPAIILPLSRIPGRYYSLTALVVGSMSPDFEYFLRMANKSWYSHQLAGILYFDLPVSIILCSLFHNAVRNSLIDHLPEFLRKRYSSIKLFDWNVYMVKSWPVVFISIVAGAFSHILWDSFTHHGGYFVNRISFLQNSTPIFNHRIAIYHLLQYLSSLIGAVAIIVFILKQPELGKTGIYQKDHYWTFVIVTMIVIFILRFAFRQDSINAGNIIVSLISGFMVGLILIPIIVTNSTDS